MTSDVELNEIGVLKRREIEARILAPVIDALGREFGRERVLAIISEVIRGVAREQGRAVARSLPESGLVALEASLAPWRKDDALEMEFVERGEERLSFNVTRCRYAEMYRELGVPELGEALSCSRDASFVEGFDPTLRLDRTQTIMQGASHCDFRYSRTSDEE